MQDPRVRVLPLLVVGSVSLGCCCGARQALATCADFPVMDGVCLEAHLESDPGGDPVCACPVTIPDPAEPFCTQPDPRAPLSASWIRAVEPDLHGFGSYPDLSALPPGQCPAAGDWSLFADQVGATGVVDIDADDAALRYIEPAFSPDSLLMAGMIR